jgi:hypothetical protein
MRVYHSKFRNTAKIEEVNIFPYCEAPKRQPAFRVSISSDYDGGFLFHVSVYETLKEALNALENLAFTREELENGTEE